MRPIADDDRSRSRPAGSVQESWALSSRIGVIERTWRKLSQPLQTAQ